MSYVAISLSSFLPLLLSLLYMVPINLNIGSFGGKPIDLAISNILLILYFRFFFSGIRVSSLAFGGLMLPFAFICIGLGSAIYNGGELSIVFSALSFSIPMFHIGVGYIVGKSRLRFSFLYVSFALSMVVLLIFLSDIIFGSFPRGCDDSGRLGGCLGKFEIYGFPNSSMNFLAVCSPLLALPFIRRSRLFWRVLALSAFLALAIVVPLGLSRSALLVYVISLSFIVMMIFGVLALFAYLFLVVLVIFSFQWIVSLGLFSGIVLRMQAALNAGDLSNGRTDIWKNATSIWLESPLLGKAFVPFSEYSMFGTAHQQYIEILYKVGLIGFSIYFFYTLVVVRLTNRLIRKDIGKTTNDQLVLVAFGVCLFLANIFQPAMSYQPMGNFLFFAMGVFVARNTLTNKVKNETNPAKSIHREIRIDRSSDAHGA